MVGTDEEQTPLKAINSRIARFQEQTETQTAVRRVHAPLMLPKTGRVLSRSCREQRRISTRTNVGGEGSH